MMARQSIWIGTHLSRHRCFALAALLLGWLLVEAAPIAQGAVDTSRLPSPASTAVDFARDIQPLFERSCLRCHGPERPKSGFQLINRETALQGGDSGMVMVVSNSAASRLIHYVARLPDVDEDFWMPPEGKAPLWSAEEVGLLRAWIDQGAQWSSEPAEPAWNLHLAPTLGGSTVSGRERVFRGHEWMPEGWNGGVEHFEYRQQLDPRTRTMAEGHVLRDDYRARVHWIRRDLGFARAGFEQFRKYYSDSGGYYAEFDSPIFALNRDLHLDLGRAWMDVGLALPQGPLMTLGYEYQYKDGDKSLTSWSPFTQAGVTRNILPNAKQVDENTHALKFDLEHQWAGLHLANNLRAEWSHLSTARSNTVIFPPGSNRQLLDEVQETRRYFQLANAFRMEKQFTSWLFGSGGYLYHHYDGDASFRLEESFVVTQPGMLRQWQSPSITLERTAHVGNVNGQFGPWGGLVGFVGLQGEWSAQRGFGLASFDAEVGGMVIPGPTTQYSELDRSTLTEHAGLRFHLIPYTTLFAEGRWQQEWTGQYENQPAGHYPLRRDSDWNRDGQDYRIGVHTSPWTRLSLSSHYRWIAKQNQYDHWVDVIPTPVGDLPNASYSAFLRGLDLDTTEVEARLSYRWTSWLKTSLSYRLAATDTLTQTDPINAGPVTGGITSGARLLAGNYDAHIYSLRATVRPLRRLNLNAAFSLHDSRTVSQANDTPSVAAYLGQTYSAWASGAYAWTARTDILGSYGLTYSDFTQDHVSSGLPLGARFVHHRLMAGLRQRLAPNVTATIRYGFYRYEEPASGRFNDYTAHLIFATVNLQMP